MSLDFAQFDNRKYPTVSVRDGYAEWVSSYEHTVQNEMDLRLLARLTSVTWNEIARGVDLGCGTGRLGMWLKQAGVAILDGVDLTPEMIELARAKGVYTTLAVVDVAETGLAKRSYGLAIASLVDEHLCELEPLYREAARVIQPGGHFVIVGYHPQFIMSSGMPTHFHRDSGEPIAIDTHVHLLSDHFKAAQQARLTLIEMDEGIIDDAWLAKKPKWRRFRGLPISFVFVWRRSGETPR